MSKAIIVENKGEGQYRIQVRYNAAVVEARLKAIETALTQGETTRVETQAALDAALSRLTVLNTLLNGVLGDSALTTTEKEKQSREVLTQVRAQRVLVLNLQGTLSSIAATRLSLLLESLRLDKVPLTREATVWSADYSPDLGIAGIEVGTIDVPGEEQEVLLYPAKNLHRAWTPAVDGDMTPVAAQTPMQWLYNTCVVTGWQKYRPTYRFATVREILDEKRMRIELIPPLKSTYGDVGIVPTNMDLSVPSYAEVECDYLDCHTQAFTVGDAVVVQYTGQMADAPKVIGFRDHPQPCAAINFYTVIGDRLRIKSRDGTWAASRRDAPAFGDSYWVGEETALSWFGRKRRHFKRQGEDVFGTMIFSRGRHIATAPSLVMGCSQVGDFLIAVCTEPARERDAAYACNLREQTPWVLLGTYQTPLSGANLYAPTARQVGALDVDTWVFSASGLRGACARRTRTPSHFALVELVLRVTGSSISGNFTVTDAIPVEETVVLINNTTCPPVYNPTNCVVDFNQHTIRTYRGVACEFVGETLHLFDEITDVHYIENASYGPPFNDCHSGGGGYATTGSGTSSTVSIKRIVCDTLGFEYIVSHIEKQSNFSMSSYGRPYDGPFGCVPYYDWQYQEGGTQKAFAIEHLNATAGAGKIVVVGRALDLVLSDVWDVTGTVMGDPVPEFPIHGTNTASIEGSQTWEIRGGGGTAFTKSLPVASSYTDATTVFTQEQLNIQSLFASGEPYAVATVASDRAGHLLASSPLFLVLRGVPALPAEVAQGRHEQFSPVGVG